MRQAERTLYVPSYHSSFGRRREATACCPDNLGDGSDRGRSASFLSTTVCGLGYVMETTLPTFFTGMPGVRYAVCVCLTLVSDGRAASAPAPSAGVRKSEAISRAMKRVWAERRKKQAQAAATPGTKSRKTPASAAKPATRKSPTAANKARRAAMRRYWAEKRKAAEMR